MADELPGGYTPYELSYSGRVLDEFAALVSRARHRGNHLRLLEAVKAIDYRLRVYPQFGEPIRDSADRMAQEWIAVVSPLIVRYVIYELGRRVNVVVPFKPMSRSGF